MYFILEVSSRYIVYVSLSKERVKRKFQWLLEQDIINQKDYDIDYLELDKFLGVKL